MKKVFTNRIISGVLALSIFMLSINTAVSADENKLTAFPGAEGGGMYSLGARAGDEIQVYHVTSLNDSGAGSFRDAVSQGNRIIVFDVAGNIMLQSDLVISASNLTILGQTAPGEGICIGGESVRFNGCNNVILRYLRFRMGDNSTSQEDTLGIRKSSNFIIDHCSVSWSVDECLSAYENKNFTAQYCIISESLNKSVHDKGAHGYGGVWGGINASFHHNLISTHKARMPRIGSSATVFTYEGTPDTDSLIDIRNNVVYNYRSTIGYGGENGTRVNFVNNYYKPSELSSNNVCFYKAYGDRGTTLYLEGNYMENNEEFNNNNWTIAFTDEDLKLTSISEGITVDGVLKANDEYIYAYPVETDTPQEAYADVIANAGASRVRDYTDTRIVNDVVNGTYPTGSKGSEGLIDSQADVGGWNSLFGNEISDSDNDGMPDEWETATGLNPNLADSTLIAENGYTNIENYANDLVEVNYNSTDKISLWTLMSRVEGLNESNYLPEQWEQLLSAYNTGKSLRADINSSQSAIDTAANELESILAYMAQDKRNDLATTIAKAEAINKQQYTMDSWAALEEAVNKGKELLSVECNDENILNEIANIEEKISGLEISYRLTLSETIEKYSQYDNDDYTEESYQNLQAVLAEARDICNTFEYSEDIYIGENEKIIDTFNSLKTIYSEISETLDFEDFEIGEYKDTYVYNNFTFYQYKYSQRSNFNVEDCNGNKVYAAVTGKTEITRKFKEPIEGIWSAQCDFMFNDKENYHTIISTYGTENIIQVRTSVNKLVFYANRRNRYIADLEVGRWYNVKVVIDADEKSLDLYLDGVLILDNAYIGQAEIYGFFMGTNSPTEKPVYLDNIKISKRFYSEAMPVYGDADVNGILTADDCANILKRVLDPAFVLPYEKKYPNYLSRIDVNCDNILTAEDAVMVLQKVLAYDYPMPIETQSTTETSTETTTETSTETTTESTTETTTEPIQGFEFNLDTLTAGKYDSPLSLNGFVISSTDD